MAEAISEDELLRIEQGSASLMHVSLPNIATIYLRYFTRVSKNVSWCTGLNKCFCQYTSGSWLTQACDLVGGITMGLSNVFPRLPAQPHNMLWDGCLRYVPVLLPYLSKMGPSGYWYNVNMLRFASIAGHLQTLLEDGQWTYRKFKARYIHKGFEVIMLGKIWVVPEGVIDKT